MIYTMLTDMAVRYNEIEISDLSKLHTKQLLKLRDLIYRKYFRCGYAADKSNVDYDIFMVKLKTVLDTREHVLNKEESKAIRKEKIKKGV